MINDALRQAIEPFLKEYKIKRAAITQYNDKGRLDNIEVIDTIKAFIKPPTRTMVMSATGQQITSTYTIVVVSPTYISAGDVIIDSKYGNLKIEAPSDWTDYGTMSASLTRFGTIDNINNNKYKEE